MKVCRYNRHSAGSLGWPFPVLKYKHIFLNKIYGSHFIKQHSETVMVWNYRNVDVRRLTPLLRCIGCVVSKTSPSHRYMKGCRGRSLQRTAVSLEWRRRWEECIFSVATISASLFCLHGFLRRGWGQSPPPHAVGAHGDTGRGQTDRRTASGAWPTHLLRLRLAASSPPVR